MDNLQHFRRTDYCGTFTAANVGQEISVCGWVQRQRNLGSLIFVDLRDRTGLLQLAFDDSTPRDLFEKAASLRGEYVIAAKGLVRERESKNPELPTGDIEVKVTPNSVCWPRRPPRLLRLWSTPMYGTRSA